MNSTLFSEFLMLGFWFVSRYVGNLHPQVTESFMQVLFGNMGTCVGCKMIYEVSVSYLEA